MQARDRRDDKTAIRIGFTATKRIGGAVVRNRAKRRLREAMRLAGASLARPGCDYVLIARGGTAERPWPRLLDDVKTALIRLAADLGAPTSSVSPLSVPGPASAPPIPPRPAPDAEH